MDFNTYAQYAAFTALLVLTVIVIILAFKSWLEEVRFQTNYYWLRATSPKIDAVLEHEDFEKHVNSVPGMQYSPHYN